MVDKVLNPIETKKSILMVEDEAILALSKTRELKRYGYNCQYVLKGEEAIEVIEKNRKAVNLILMDVDLGKGLDGIQTAREILRNHDIPILFLSSHEEKEIVAKTEDVTSYGYVVKSSSITVLDASIKMAFKLHRNIADRIKAEKKQQLTNSLLRKTIDGVQDPIMLIGLDYKIQMYNKAVKDKYFSDENSKSLYCYQISHDRLEPCSEVERVCPLQCIKETLRPCSLTHKHIQKDGSIRIVELHAVPVFDENKKLTGFIETAHDITENKQLENNLKESEKKFADLFNKAPLSYQSLDADGNFIEVNQAWLEILGYSKEEVIGKWFGDFLAMEYVEPFRERFPIFKKKEQIHSEFKMIKKDGSQILISFEGRIGHNDDGTFKQTHCILYDITNQ